MSIKTKIVGVTHKDADGTNRQKLLSKLGSGSQLVFKPEPENAYSDHAVAVFNSAGEQLGYLNDDLKDIVTRKNSDDLCVLGKVLGVVPAYRKTPGLW